METLIAEPTLTATTEHASAMPVTRKTATATANKSAIRVHIATTVFVREAPSCHQMDVAVFAQYAHQ